MNLNFDITLYGELEPYNEILSKSRARIFYKYRNRNGTYISDDFSEKLLSSLPYTPIKGIFSIEENDYTDHGEQRNEGRIYGIVPETTNVQWELHTDSDGIEREYACTDVLIFTALYEEARSIVGKALSMELYEPSIKYHEVIHEGQRYIAFDEGKFLGLQVLGDKVEPCFEGASFYTLQKNISKVLEEIKEYSYQGGNIMPDIQFKLSDGQKHEMIWRLLNTEYNEENNWTCSYSITAIYEDYALVYNYATEGYERIYYTKNDDTDSIELGEVVQVFVVDVTEKEKETLDTLKKLNCQTYECVNENLTNANENAEKCENYELKIQELDQTIITLNTEIDQNKSDLEISKENYTNAENQISSLNDELVELREYKKSIETENKQNVIKEYSKVLSNDLLNSYAEHLDDFSVIDLDKELAYELKKSGINFTQDAGFIPKRQTPDGLDAILSKYKH